MSGWVEIGEHRWILDVTYVVSKGLLGILELRKTTEGKWRIFGSSGIVSRLRDTDLKYMKRVAEKDAAETIRAAFNVMKEIAPKEFPLFSKKTGGGK